MYESQDNCTLTLIEVSSELYKQKSGKFTIAKHKNFANTPAGNAYDFFCPSTISYNCIFQEPLPANTNKVFIAHFVHTLKYRDLHS